MRNRAKCKNCDSILESFTLYDYVECSCGGIAIDGGSYRLNAYARNWENFLRIDDDGKITPISFVEKPSEYQKEAEHQQAKEEPKQLAKEGIMYEIDSTIQRLENLQILHQSQPLTQNDLKLVFEYLKRLVQLLALPFASSLGVLCRQFL